MEKQGLSFRGMLFLITVGTGLGALLPVVAGLHQLTIYWWMGLYALTLAAVLRLIPASYPEDSVEEG